MTKVQCPRCGRAQAKQNSDTIYWCAVCQAQFDDDPDEGGDYFTDPSRRLELSERRKKNRRH